MSQAVEQVARNAMDAHRAGRFEEAERLCRHALAEDPTYFRSLVHLSVLLRNKGEFPESVALADQAVAAQPNLADGYVQLALALLGGGHPGDSIPAFQKAISITSEVAPLHFHLGLALENVGRIEEASLAFLEASRLDPKDVRSRLSLGSILLANEDLRAARSQAEQALASNPVFAQAHQFMAKVLAAEGKPLDAEQSIRRSLELEPDSAYGHFMLGFRLLQKGDFEGAENACMRSIELEPVQGTAYFGVTQARKMKESDRPLIDRMLQVLEGAPLTLEQAMYLHFGLGKALDNLGECEQAIHHFEEAHRNAHLMRYRDNPFSEEEYAQEIAATKRLYTRELIGSSVDGFSSDVPIFVVGMMRSGTTLTEQILSSHRQVGAAGEQWFWPQRAHLTQDLAAGVFNAPQAKTVARDYVKELRKLAPHVTRVTDKLPGNYLRLGLLNLALPRAKFIHCRRNPVDTSLSIYFTANPVAPDYTHTKEGIAFVYRRYLELMEHWRAVLPPGRLYEVQYEDLVTDPEPVIRGMLEFLELEWDSACLRHDKNEKDVRTPSLWQVRQPIYSSSVDRWRRYEPWLGPLRDLLTP